MAKLIVLMKKMKTKIAVLIILVHRMNFSRFVGCLLTQHVCLFRCNNGNCVPLPWVCDGKIDCVDGEDEEDQHCSDKRVNACQKNEFSCGDGSCIPSRYT